MTFTRDTLESGGQVGRDLLAVDWEATPLGHPDRWPASLRNAVRILLTSRFSMWMASGPDLTFLCNEAYRRDTLGKKYPWALGKPASLVWSEIWDDIGPHIEHVMTTGEATWDESLRLFLERSGYVEETYHTFSYSPLADDDGDITGMLCVVKEDTEQVIAARRMTTLRDLGDHSGGLSEAASIREACGILRENPWSLPFTLLYHFEETGSARLAGSTGFAGPHPAAPDTVAADEPDPGWPAAEALAGRTVVVQDLRSRYDDLPTGAWDEPPRCALVVLVQVRGELVTDESGHRVLRGSVQDITEQRALERAVAQAAAREQVAAREHAIADELQRRLLPRDRYELDRLDVATYYRSGVEGTQVGGDWFDVVELGVGRVALVVGDVMGRGIPAASVMGQVRSALRAMVRLDLDPGQVVEQLDGFVRDLDGDQIVTCVVAVLDPTDHALHYANAGHVPPVLGAAEGAAVRLDATAPPLGTGGVSAVVRRLELPPGAQLTLFTDGLVEHRGESLDRGLDALAGLLATVDGMPLAGVPQHLVDTLLPEGPDDDVALLVARVTGGARARTVTVRLGDRLPVIARAREQVATTLQGWGVPAEVTEDLKVMASELVTNALLHGEPPLDVRLTPLGSEIVLEVDDRSPARPHRVAADRESEHGRGLQIVATLADRWGTRTTGTGKTVWCSRNLPPARERRGHGRRVLECRHAGSRRARRAGGTHGGRGRHRPPGRLRRGPAQR